VADPVLQGVHAQSRGLTCWGEGTFSTERVEAKVNAATSDVASCSALGVTSFAEAADPARRFSCCSSSSMRARMLSNSLRRAAFVPERATVPSPDFAAAGTSLSAFVDWPGENGWRKRKREVNVATCQLALQPRAGVHKRMGANWSPQRYVAKGKA
jgi:hypothetical protein